MQPSRLSSLASFLVLCSSLLASTLARADEQGVWRGWPTPPLLGHSIVVDTTAQRLLLIGGRTSAGANRQVLQRNLLVYGLGGILVPFIGIKTIDVIVTTLNLA